MFHIYLFVLLKIFLRKLTMLFMSSDAVHRKPSPRWRVERDRAPVKHLLASSRKPKENDCGETKAANDADKGGGGECRSTEVLRGCHGWGLCPLPRRRLHLVVGGGATTTSARPAWQSWRRQQGARRTMANLKKYLVKLNRRSFLLYTAIVCNDHNQPMDFSMAPLRY